MRFGKYLTVCFLIICFTLGFMLGLNQHQDNIRKEQQNKHMNSEKKQLEIHDELQIIDQSMISTNNTTIESGQNEADNSPDLEYYKKARVLQEQYPHTFIMKHQTTHKKIALTFDDGPDGKTTQQILDILNQYDIPATFFLVGENIKSYPNVVKRMIDEGHQVANHSWSHLRPTDLSLEEFILEVDTAEKILQDTNISSQFFYYRPPYGLVTPIQIEAMETKRYKIISWSIDSLDWLVSEPEKIRDKVIYSAHPGAIVLMHSAGGKNQRIGTIKALPGIIETLTRQGYEFVTVHDLINER